MYSDIPTLFHLKDMPLQNIKNGTFILGDCLEEMKQIPDGCIDMILCDLPYGTTACKWDVIIPFDKLWTQYNRIIKDDGAIVLTSSTPFTYLLVNSNFNNFKYPWYWNKDKAGNFATAKYQPLRVVEDILIFGKSSVKYNPQMETAEVKNIRPRNSIHVVKKDTTHGMASGEFKVSENHNEKQRFPKNLINIKSTEKECNNVNRIHPTQKPVALFEYLIKTYSNEGDLILDNCAGSGTTAIACENTNRKWVCIEQDETYANAAVERIKNHVVPI